MSESDSCVEDNVSDISFINLSNDPIEIRHVYHMSDIHIRKNNVRKEEYLEVFKNTYDIIRKGVGNKATSLIVLTGDILHFKTDLCPDSILMTNNFLRNLTLIAPVIVIPGNHDCNLSNRQRLDSLSPIIKDIGNLPNIYYLKNSGFYRYNNIVFGVTSIFDQKVLSAKMLSKKHWKELVYDNKYMIALYHGSVHSAETDVGYRMNNTDLLVKDFKGYDFVMLGDIHKFQYLNDEKTVAYAGSLIQQSHGEKIKGHGILKWDLKRSDSEHIEVPNSYGFCTIKITDGKMEDKVKIPPKPRIRFILENTNQLEYQDIVSKIEAKYHVEEIIKESDLKMISRLDTNQKKKGTKSSSKSSENTPLYQNENMNAYETQEKIFRDFLAKKKTSTDQINSILGLHREIYQIALAEKDDKDENNLKLKKNGVKWDILELRFSNTLSYGKDNIIDFRNFNKNQIIGIAAPNRYGKTAILDIILFCLFDKMSRGERRDILNVNETTMNCSLTFSVGAVTYMVERNGHVSKNGQNVTIDVSFYMMLDDSKRKCLNGIDKNETNKKIVELIGDYDDYMTTSFYLQSNKNNNFIEMTHLRKKEYLNDILKLNVFEDCHRIAKDKIKELEGEIKALTNIAGNASASELIESIKTLRKTLSAKESKLDLIESTILPDLVEDIANIKERINMIKIPELNNYDLESGDNINKVINELNEKLLSLNTIDVDNVKKLMDEITQKEAIVVSKIKELDAFESLKKLRNQSEQYQKEIVYIPPNFNEIDESKINDEIKSYDTRIENINSLLEKFPDDLNEKIDQISNLKETVIELRKKLTNKTNRIAEIPNFVQKEGELQERLHTLIKNSKNVGVNVEEIIKYKDPFESFLKNNIKLLSTIENPPKQVLKVIKQQEEWINTYQTWKDNSVNMSVISKSAYAQSIDKIIREIDDINEKIININLDYIDHQNDKGLLRQITHLEKEIENLSEYNGSKKEKDLLLNEIKLIQEKRKISSNNLKLINKYSDASSNNKKLEKNIANLKIQIKQIEKEQQQLESTREELRNNFDLFAKKLKKNEEKIKKHEKISEHLYLLKKNEKKYDLIRLETILMNELIQYETEYTKSSNQLRVEIENLKGQLTAAEKNYEGYLSVRDKYDSKTTEANLYQLYYQVTDYNGLPYEILKEYLPLIGNDINQTLHSMVDFDIQFVFHNEEAQAQSKKKGGKSAPKVLMGAVNINICPPGLRPHNVSLGSQFEKFIIGLAIRMTFGQISLTAKPNFLIVDEGWASLDKDYKNEIPKILAYIKNQYEHVILISHLDELKEQYDHTIEIHRINDRSYVNTQRKMIKSSKKLKKI